MAMLPDVELLYRQHLTEADRELVARVTGAPDLGRALGHPDLEASLFRGPLGELPAGGLATASPFLAFAVAVHRSADRLARASFVEERWAPRQRIPVFDVAPLREFLGEPLRRYFLVELLASYTRVASGVTWTRTARGWRRRRFSELDPVRLAELLEVVEPPERAGVYRRLGDLALFLTGMFPDHSAVQGIEGLQASRLLRLSGLSPALGEELGGAALLEHLGARWYRQAARALRGEGRPLTATMPVVSELGQRFGDARRALNVVADDFLFPLRGRWFGIA